MIVPTTHRIVVKQRNLTEISKEHKRMQELGWVIPETEDKKRAQAGVDQGTVIAFGPTVFVDFNTGNPVQVGDYIAFAKYSGKIVTDPDDGEEYVVINDEDVVAIIKEAKKNG